MQRTVDATQSSPGYVSFPFMSLSGSSDVILNAYFCALLRTFMHLMHFYALLHTFAHFCHEHKNDILLITSCRDIFCDLAIPYHNQGRRLQRN
jgi:hypothetical protein